MTDIQTPELDRQLEIVRSGKAELIQEFYDYLIGRGWQICTPQPTHRRLSGFEERYYPIDESPEDLMAGFFGIDRNTIESERRLLLANLGGAQ